MKIRNAPRVDKWVWGIEKIIWGFNPGHQFTLKILEPKLGRAGCLSLQYHRRKSESWVVFRGQAWALVVVDGEVCTRLMQPGDFQNLEAGVIHRLMALSNDLQVIELSTLEQHAADKKALKDVVRLHCLQGRDTAAPVDQQQAAVVMRCIEITQEAIDCLENGADPPEYGRTTLLRFGPLNIDSVSA